MSKVTLGIYANMYDLFKSNPNNKKWILLFKVKIKNHRHERPFQNYDIKFMKNLLKSGTKNIGN